jgi:hypothetical protein
LRGLAAAVPDDLNVSGEQLPQAVDVAFPERVEEPRRQLWTLTEFPRVERLTITLLLTPIT